MHKGILCHHSGYFRAALQNDQFEEAKTHEFVLDDQDPAIVSIAVSWLYTNRLCNTPPSQDAPSQKTLCRLWIFGDRHDIPTLKAFVINKLYYDLKNTEKEETLNLDYLDGLPEVIFENSTESSGLRSLIVEAYALSPAAWYTSFSEEWPKEFLIALTRRMGLFVIAGGREKTAVKHWGEMDLCQFHEHHMSSGKTLARRASRKLDNDGLEVMASTQVKTEDV